MTTIKGLEIRERWCRSMAENIKCQLETTDRHKSANQLKDKVWRMNILFVEANTIKKCLEVFK